MVSLARHFVPNPVSSNRTDRRLKCQCPLFLHTRYDGRNYRTLKRTYDAGQLDETRHFYYSHKWQVLEERVDASTAADCQYVWGLRYIDDLLLRDRDNAAGGDLGKTGSGLDERLYVLQDPNWNVVAIAEPDGDVVQRFTYNAYGEPKKLDLDFTDYAGPDYYNWPYLYTGRRLDELTGLYYYRERYYHSTLGRFISRDPLGYLPGPNLYAYVDNSPIVAGDPTGLLSTEAQCLALIRGHKKSIDPIMNQFRTRGCKKPGIVCEDCAGEAHYSPLGREDGGKIVLCYGRRSKLKEERFEISLRHEVMHAWDDCVCREDNDEPFLNEGCFVSTDLAQERGPAKQQSPHW